jgi:hypothetical protein
MAYNFLGLNLTPSHDKNMLQEIHLFPGKLTFHPVGKKFVFTKLTQNLFQIFRMLLCHLKIHQDIININDHELIQLFMENQVHEVVIIDETLHNLNGIIKNL